MTEKIISICFEVHKLPGIGFQELIYQRALVWELSQEGQVISVKFFNPLNP